MHRKTVLLFLALLVLAIASICIWDHFRYLRCTLADHKPFVVYTPHWFANVSECVKRTNISAIEKDLDLVKSLGFDGIKLFCIEGIEWSGPGIQKVLDACEKKGLNVTLPFRIWRPYQFPENETAIDEFTSFLKTVIPKVRDSTALVAYIIHYPINFTDKAAYAEKWFSNEIYKAKLEEIINQTHFLDPAHPIWMALEFDPHFNPPLDVEHVEAYGVEPYSWYTPEKYDPDRVRLFLGYFEEMNMQVFIDEYGVQTNNPELIVGHAPSETIKAGKIRDFILDVCDKGYVWAYFSLFDTSQTDWGLAYDNGTLKESGRIVQDLLTSMRKSP
ncbi:MAG: hypothetical protein ACETWE_05820 [Candidatus Bathyarchaeia archaeon]